MIQNNGLYAKCEVTHLVYLEGVKLYAGYTKTSNVLPMASYTLIATNLNGHLGKEGTIKPSGLPGKRFINRETLWNKDLLMKIC